MPENPLHNTTPTAQTALKEGVAFLRGHSPTASLDAVLLLGHIIGVDRAWLLSRGEVQLTPAQYERFRQVIAQRREGTPIAYITCLAGFYKRMFLVNEHVLVPRPETELLVEAAIEYLRERVRAGAHAVRVLEIGTGSGAIACTIAAEVPQAYVEATDVSAQAVNVALRNAERLGIAQRCRFRQADIAGDEQAVPFDAMIANLPYIPTAEVPEKPDPAGFEPRVALDGGPDGMAVYARLLGEYAWCLRGAGILLMEAAPATMPRLRALTAAALPGSFIEVRRDYGGLERFLYVTPSRAGTAAG